MLLILGGVAASLLPQNIPPMNIQNEFKSIRVGGVIVSAEVASTAPAREKGLSGHRPLGEQEGMLFVFDKDDTYGFWMKDMQFAIDIIWIDAEGKIITIAKNVEPASYPEVFYPARPARYVLEVPAGFAQKRSLAEGGKVVLK